MSGNENIRTAPAVQAPKKKGPKVMAIIFAVGLTGFLATALWVNWPKPRVKPEPLSPAVAAVIRDMPGTSDAMIYVGMKEIRQSRFWKEAVPDSLKRKGVFGSGSRLGAVLQGRGINIYDDLDTLLISFQRSGRKQQKFVGMAWGSFASKAPAGALDAASIETATVAGRKAYALDSALWVCPTGARTMAIGSSTGMIEGLLKPQGSLLQRDSVTAALIGRTTWKSHLWFALASPQWTSGALQSFTAKNRDVRSVGNLSKVNQILLSAKMNDGVQAETEWIYRNPQAAYFASTFLWGTIKLAGAPGTRTPETTKKLLNNLKVQQNLESVIVTTDLPMTAFRKNAAGR